MSRWGLRSFSGDVDAFDLKKGHAMGESEDEEGVMAQPCAVASEGDLSTLTQFHGGHVDLETILYRYKFGDCLRHVTL